MDDTEEQGEKQWEANLKPFQFKPGQSGNPGGRPKGSKSLKTYVKEMLQSMTDEEKLEFLKGMDKKVIWEMGEDKPKQGTELSGNLNISQVLDELENGSAPKE
jgi:hypothetical protein